jgi:chemotaxis protein CheZ|tara:strand:- start:1301 stop:2077 length:777 start_codon:yes stop_codon:yes gene_type:complete
MSSKETLEISESSYLTEAYMKRLQSLTVAFESRDEAQISEIVGELTTLRESSLYQELGMLTREIHDAMSTFGNDERIAQLATEDIPDAKERLNFIVTKTDEAAHRTMTVAEETMEVMDSFSGKADAIRERWAQFRNRELSKDDFIQLSNEITQFFDSVEPESATVNSKMTEIMLAQDYQDITGQMIKQVVVMVKEVEEKLVRLVAISGLGDVSLTKKEVISKSSDGEKAEGPQLPTADKEVVASSQGDVDDLLASLGF